MPGERVLLEALVAEPAASRLLDEPAALSHADAAGAHQRARLGMWTFLATEVLFFGGALTVYAAYRAQHAAAFALASRRLDLRLGTANTAILILSSLTMALGVEAARRRLRRRLAVCLAATAALGA